MKDDVNTLNFSDLGLSEAIMKGLTAVGYETPSAIQAKVIPHVLARTDVVGQAQTGTGKTAAFALPLLSILDLKQKDPQVLVLAPTRELAIQVAEAFQTYAAYIKGFHVLPIYGGSDYGPQLKQLKRGVHVVVGTPGRVTDHIRRGTLRLDKLRCLVLDEADEMLSMGFIEDIEWILEQSPSDRQITLFSATMPDRIKRISRKYLTDPVEIKIKVKTTIIDTIHQRHWMVSGLHKLDALTRILEFEPFDGILVFVKTKTLTITLAEKLQARGYSCSPLNGDIPQKQRERTVTQLKQGKIDIIVATDVAARGLDIERISHVINYDIPQDIESYIHRIGRTGRAGRKGEAILFVSPRERRMLRAIESATKQKIELMKMPSTDVINDTRVARFKQIISDTLASGDLEFYTKIMEQYRQEHDIPSIEIAAALAKLVQGDKPLLLPKQKAVKEFSEKASTERPSRKERSHEERPSRKNDKGRFKTETERFRIQVGEKHQVKVGDIVTAIAEAAGLNRKNVGTIEVMNDYTTVELPSGMPDDAFEALQSIVIANQELRITLDKSSPRKRKTDKPMARRKKGKKRY